MEHVKQVQMELWKSEDNQLRALRKIEKAVLKMRDVLEEKELEQAEYEEIRRDAAAADKKEVEEMAATARRLKDSKSMLEREVTAKLRELE
jgi:hypothetical protein